MDNLSNRPERPRKTRGKGKQGKKSSFGRRIFRKKIYLFHKSIRLLKPGAEPDGERPDLTSPLKPAS